MRHSLIIAVTDMGDGTVIAALVAFCSAYLKGCGCGRAAGMLASALALAVMIIGLLKLLFLGCDPLKNPLHLHSPSGHAAISTAVYGALALLAARRMGGHGHLLPVAVATLLVAAIALSRIWLGAHSLDEIIIGVLSGLLALWLSYRLLLHGKTLPPFSVGLLGIAILLAVVIFHGIRLPAEAFLQGIAVHFHAYNPLCRH